MLQSILFLMIMQNQIPMLNDYTEHLVVPNTFDTFRENIFLIKTEKS